MGLLRSSDLDEIIAPPAVTAADRAAGIVERFQEAGHPYYDELLAPIADAIEAAEAAAAGWNADNLAALVQSRQPRIIHTHEPRATEVDVDVALTTTGRTLTVKVGRAAQPGETDDEAADRAVELSHRAYQAAIDCYTQVGVSFGKLEAGAK